MSTTASKHSIGLRIVAVGKLCKCAGLIVVGVTIVAAAHGGDAAETVRHWSDALGIDEGNHVLQELVGKLTGVNPRSLREIGLGSFIYATLFAIEGVGLWMQKRWAEYFTIAITLSFVPLEIFEIVHRTTAARIAMLAVNILVVVYLVLRVRRERRQETSKKLGERALAHYELRRDT